jgi:hypothetical protein
MGDIITDFFGELIGEAFTATVGRAWNWWRNR